LGLDEVWLGDEGPARDPFALLAAAALRTKRIKLGVAVTNPYLRHPSTTAASALTVHELSGGRMILGIGPGGDLALGPAQVERTRPLAATQRAVRIIRAVAHGEATEGYTPAPHALTAPDLPVFIGARGEHLNRLASSVAHGVFLGGIPRVRLAPTVAWARSVRPIAVSAYLNAIFDRDSLEALRPRLVYAFLDAPRITRDALGVCRAEAAAAARAMARGEDGPARAVVDDQRLAELVVYGASADAVGRELAVRLEAIEPTSIGITLLGTDPMRHLKAAAEALAVAVRALAGGA
jgi:5,10-methylenetetrahydromethanopterin reductase